MQVTVTPPGSLRLRLLSDFAFFRLPDIICPKNAACIFCGRCDDDVGVAFFQASSHHHEIPTLTSCRTRLCTVQRLQLFSARRKCFTAVWKSFCAQLKTNSARAQQNQLWNKNYFRRCPAVNFEIRNWKPQQLQLPYCALNGFQNALLELSHAARLLNCALNDWKCGT